MYFTRRALLCLDWPQFKCSVLLTANMLDSVGGEDGKGSKGEVRLTMRPQEETGSPHPLTQEGSTGVSEQGSEGQK